EFERVRVLVLFHELQVGEPLSPFESIAIRKLWLSSFDQIRGHCIFAIGGETVSCFDDLRVGKPKIVNEKFCAIHPAWMSQTLEIRLPVPNVLIIDSVDYMLAQDVIGLMGIGLIGEEIRRNEV